MSEAGRSGDYAHVPTTVQAVQSDLRPFLWRDGFQALARLGAVEALPLFGNFLFGWQQKDDLLLTAPRPSGPDWLPVFTAHADEINFTTVAKARLLAEAHTKTVPDVGKRAEEKVHSFFRHLDTTPAALNADLYAYRHPPARLNDQGQQVSYVSTGPTPQPTVLYALCHLADMVYQGVYADFAVLPDIVLTHFRDDYGSALKMRYAPLPRPERLPALIDEISRLQVLRGETYQLLQLAINEGAEAAERAALRVTEMEAQLDDYSHIGFTALFMVIGGLGDPQYEPFLRRFIEAPHKTNCKTSIYYDVRDGIRCRLVSAY